MKRWPALDIASEGDEDLIVANLVDFKVTALEEREGGLRAYFVDATERDRALAAFVSSYRAAPVEVDDEDWARRSQENLDAVRVERITILPPWRAEQLAAGDAQHYHIVIQPSMGFGTGHHATTRVCLELLQQIDLRGKSMLDVGTGSGVLALAARMMGAREALGIDNDPDAIQSARENLTFNPQVEHVTFRVADVREAPPSPADVVTANLTAALLVASAPLLRSLVAAGGTLIVSGLQTDDRDDVFAALRPLEVGHVRGEDGWVGAAFNRTGSKQV